MEWRINDITIETARGDIAAQEDMEAVVNAANAELETGGGVAGALHRTAGPELAAAGEKYAPISPGEAVVTEAFQLPNKKVIHCLGPVYGKDHPAEELLIQCYINSLKRAEEEKLKSIVFPAISTGAFGYPFHEAMKTAVGTVLEQIGSLRQIKHIRFLLFSQEEKEKYTAHLAETIGQ
ncbi:macro domain-containing protein [Alkalicoccus daliensis]|uniref:O-acetyl-ADP-ribose deacetylase (Regulator of RNase III), contains Macro domain n=1 Tax=Alkalicoccus daliensis TaxID=745820 RepID=A0A1H0EVJ8_9BACI|nr:macro domain-containing protein [Alkalicoccus daliensis]SDN86457.1 O-acetyl-ADP-ribose deacetylase (regulator of RNase III), contains Macro domain [Alkalicoccus daliensis]